MHEADSWGDVLPQALEVDNVPDALTAAYDNIKANLPSISDGMLHPPTTCRAARKHVGECSASCQAFLP